MSHEPKAIQRLQNELMFLAVGIIALAWVAVRAAGNADRVRRELLLERDARGRLAEERDQAKRDLDGALERLHEHIEGVAGTPSKRAPEPEPEPEPKTTPARRSTSRGKPA